jgi:hypothetical protein
MVQALELEELALELHDLELVIVDDVLGLVLGRRGILSDLELLWFCLFFLERM